MTIVLFLWNYSVPQEHQTDIFRRSINLRFLWVISILVVVLPEFQAMDILQNYFTKQ